MDKEYIQDQYFTPLIEDIRVGYECEINNPPEWELEDKWYKYILDYSDMDWVYEDHLLENGKIRVFYLTQDQLKSEPECKVAYSSKDEETWIITKGSNKSTPILIYSNSKKTLNFNGLEMLCKDINDFRLIVKLLGI